MSGLLPWWLKTTSSCVRWLQRHRADVVGGSQFSPRFQFGTQGELINGTSIWDSHGNLSIKHRVNPMDGMVLAWYPLASEIDPWHAPVLTKVGNPKRLSWKQPKCTISIYKYDKFQKDQHLFRGPITAFFQKNWFPKAWKSTDYGWLCHVGCHLWG